VNGIKCPECGDEAVQALVNGRPAMVCESCINGVMTLTQCQYCNEYRYKRQQKVCGCRETMNE
jgi:hypothetical protein